MRGDGNFTVQSKMEITPVVLEFVENASYDGMVNICVGLGEELKTSIGFFRDGTLTLTEIDKQVADRMGIRLSISGHILLQRRK